MSGPEPITPRCEMCGEPSTGEYPDGYHLCAHHLEKAKRRESLEADLIGVVSAWSERHNLTAQEFFETVEAIQQPMMEAADDESRNAPDFIAKRSHGPRDSYEGGFRRPFDVVPERSLEKVYRDVTVTYENVPLWAVETLFDRTQKDLGNPDIEEVEAHLIVKYSNLDERTYERLNALRESYSWHGEPTLEITRTSLYPPRHLAEQRMREVEKERSEKPRE